MALIHDGPAMTPDERRKHPARGAAQRIALDVRAKLCKRFPAAFRGEGISKPPLAIGIDGEIRKRWPEINVRHLSLALRNYTTGPTYLRNLVPGAARIDLDGNPASTVTDAQAALAAKLKEKIEGLRECRRLRIRSPACAKWQPITNQEDKP